MEFKEFRELVQKKDKKDFKITNSFNIYQIYKFIRKNHWYDIGRPVTEKEFYSIIRGINNRLADNLVHGESIAFPERMGTLELRKRKTNVSIDKNGKLKVGYPIDWDKTLRLWYEDKEAHDNKTLIRNETEYIYRVKYDKYNATYTNKIFYEFKIHKKVKVALKENINKGITDTLW